MMTSVDPPPAGIDHMGGGGKNANVIFILFVIVIPAIVPFALIHPPWRTTGTTATTVRPSTAAGGGGMTMR